MLHNISLKASFVYIMYAILTTLSTVTEPTLEKPSPFIVILDPPLNNKVSEIKGSGCFDDVSFREQLGNICLFLRQYICIYVGHSFK
jgi:hypothetical protein